MPEITGMDYAIEDGIPEGCTFERIALDNIEATAATQIRVKLDPGMIDQYTEDMMNGAKFPPLDVFREANSERNILADGFQRQRSAINAKWGDIGCIVHPGGMHEALVFAMGANFNHGLRRSNRDKRNAVEMALKDPEISQMQQQEIADICRVTRQTVRRIHHELLAEDDDSSEGNNGTKSHDPKVDDPKDDDYRDTGAEISQEDNDLDELRQMCALGKGIAYDGADSIGKLAYTKDDIADLEYISTWCANAVIAFRGIEKANGGG